MPSIMIKEEKYKEVQIWGKTVRTKFTFIDQLCKKLRNGYSPIIGICGGQRTGKSFIGLWIALLIYKLTEKEFIPGNITFYDPEQAIKKLKDKEREVILIDEAGDVMDYQEWHKKTHRALRSMINTQAYKNNLYIFISPFLAQIDKSLRIHCDFIIHVKARGRFLAWKYAKKYDAEEIKKGTSKVFLDNGGISMKEIPKPIWNEYLKHSIEEKEKMREQRIILEKSKVPINDMQELIKLSKMVKGD